MRGISIAEARWLRISIAPASIAGHFFDLKYRLRTVRKDLNARS